MTLKLIHKQLFAAFIFCALFPFISIAQNHEQKSEKESFHRVMLVLGHTHVPSGIDLNGKAKWLTLASWGLDYDYWFSEKWAAGLHTDMVVENYSVKVDESFDKSEVLNRKAPVTLVVSGIYKPGEHLNVIAGFGEEFSEEENLFLLRVGLDVGWELGEKYEVSISLMGDFKVEAYNSITIGIGIGRIF